MMHERRLIELFKSFVEKALLPQIKKFDGTIQQWKKFSSMLSQQSINYQEIANYVDNIGGSNTNIPTLQKNTTPFFLRKQQDSQPSTQPNSQEQSTSFNANKTFGGQRARMALFAKFDQESQQRKFDSYKDNFNQRSQQNSNSQHTYAIQRLMKNFNDYQIKIEQVLNNIPESNYNNYEKMYG